MALILVADDEETIRGLISAVLKQAGHQVVLAANGLEAVAFFRSYPRKVQLVITDMQMPVMDGHQVIDLVRETNPAAKVICMSGYDEREIPSDVAFLHKPFLPTQLRELVNQTLAA